MFEVKCCCSRIRVRPCQMLTETLPHADFRNRFHKYSYCNNKCDLSKTSRVPDALVYMQSKSSYLQTASVAPSRGFLVRLAPSSESPKVRKRALMNAVTMQERNFRSGDLLCVWLEHGSQTIVSAFPSAKPINADGSVLR